MSRAEKFEDEKRRITQSCFAKKESDGTCMWITSTFPPSTMTRCHALLPRAPKGITCLLQGRWTIELYYLQLIEIAL